MRGFDPMSTLVPAAIRFMRNSIPLVSPMNGRFRFSGATLNQSLWRVGLVGACLVVSGAVACRGILDAPPPLGVITEDALQNRAGAENVFASAKAQFFSNYAGGSGIALISGLFSDEFICSDNVYGCGIAGLGGIDTRQTTGLAGIVNQTVFPNLAGNRGTLLIAHSGLSQFEPAGGQKLAGEALALVGFNEVFLAENFCAGTTLDAVKAGGGWTYGPAYSLDSLLGIAEAHFQQALVSANGDTAVASLASVGLARVRLDRGDFSGAGSVVSAVVTGFQYNAVTDPTGANGPTNLYNSLYNSFAGAFVNVADHEGGNGLSYRSSRDPRLVLDSAKQTRDGDPFYYPVRFGLPSSVVPLANGIEARLIEAEAALHAGQISTWLSALNNLRTTCADAGSCATPAPAGSGGVAGLPPLADPGTNSGRIALTFQERAFWLFGTGHRLGDMRRLVRQYGVNATSVYPVGAYSGSAGSNAPVTYGTDISIALPDPAAIGATNPAYHGCSGAPTSD